MAETEIASSRRFDWAAAEQKLAKLQSDIDSGERPLAERVEAILRSRAAALAKPLDEARPAATVRLLTFVRRGQRWAVNAEQIGEAVAVTELAYCPGLPEAYLGLIHYHGEVFPLIDITVPFRIGANEPGEHKQALIVRHDGAAIALAADDTEGLKQVDTAAIAAMPPDTNAHMALQGLTPDRAIVFDAFQLLNDPRLVVNEQPATVGRNSEGDAQ